MPSYHNHEVQFSHNRTRLAGTLLLPDANDLHAALVMIPGDGAASRDNFGYFPAIARHFARYGIAVLCYDRPGVGKSTGSWKQQDLHDRTGEALEALRFLQSRSKMAPERVGLWGIDQGGWIVSHAASVAPNLGFVISVSAPAVSPAEQNRYGLENFGRAREFPEHEIQHAMRLYETVIDVARRAGGAQQIEPLVSRLRNDVWDGYWGDVDSTLWRFLKRDLDHDPVTPLRTVTCPILSIFGECDSRLPLQRTVANVEQALTRAGNRDATIHVFPEADQKIEIGEPPGLAPGYLETMVAWIWRRAAAAEEQF